MERLIVWVPSDNVRAGEAVTVYDGAGNAIARATPRRGFDSEDVASGFSGPPSIGIAGRERPAVPVLTRPLATGVHTLRSKASAAGTGVEAGTASSDRTVYVNTAPPAMYGMTVSAAILSGERLRFSWAVLEE